MNLTRGLRMAGRTAACWCALGMLMVFATVMSIAVRAQGVITTTVQGTVYLANGEPGSGTLMVRWPAFSTASGQAVAAGSLTAKIPADGFVSVNLAPNLGSTPAGQYYTVVLYLVDGSTSTEYWVVPAASTATLAQVRAQVMPAAQAVQAVSKAYVDQTVSQLQQSLLTASGGSLTGPLYLSGDPTQGSQAANKHYVDAMVGTANAGSMPLTGGALTGSLSGTSASFSGAVVSGTSFSGPGTGLTGTAPLLSIGGNAATATSATDATARASATAAKSAASAAQSTADAALPANGCSSTVGGNLACAASAIGKTMQLPGSTQAAGTLQAAITAGGAGATIILPANYAETVSTAVTISNANVTLRCEKGAMLTAGPAVSKMLAVSASNVTVEGCAFDNNLQAANGSNVLMATSTDRLVFRNNTVLNLPNGTNALLLSSATNADVSHNYLTNVQGGGIAVNGAGHDVLISSNVIDGTNQPILAPHGGGTIIFVTGTTLTGYSNVQVSNNTLTTATDFCIAIGGTTGHPYVNSSVSGNTCYIKNTTGTNTCETAPASRACGGISVNGNQVTSDLAITNNAIYGAGQNVSIAGIELVACLSCSVAGNNIQMTPGSSSTATGIVNNGSINSNITGNLINGWVTSTTTAAYPAGILHIGGDNSTITGNTLIFPPDGGSHIVYGVELNCGSTGITIRNAAVSGNTFAGNGAASSSGVFAIDALGGACPITAVVSGNSFTNLSGGISTGGAADVAVQAGVNLFTASVTNPQVAASSATNATTIYGPITAPSAVGFIKAFTVQTDGTSKLTANASQGGGGSFLNHTGSGHFYITSSNNVYFQPAGGGTTVTIGGTGLTANGLVLSGGTNMTANHGTGTSLQHSDGTGTSQAAYFDANGNLTATAPAGTTGSGAAVMATSPSIATPTFTGNTVIVDNSASGLANITLKSASGALNTVDFTAGGSVYGRVGLDTSGNFYLRSPAQGMSFVSFDKTTGFGTYIAGATFGGVVTGTNTVSRTTSTTMTTAWTTTGLVLPSVPLNTIKAGHCTIYWQMSSTSYTATFGLGMSSAPTNVWGSAEVIYNAAGTSNFLAFTQSATATTAISTAATAGAAATTYAAQIDFTLQTNATNAVVVTLYGQTNNASGTLSIMPGSVCYWMP